MRLWVRIRLAQIIWHWQISTSKLIHGNAATCSDIHGRDAVGTLAPSILPSTMHIKLDYTVDYYSFNSTEKDLFYSLTQLQFRVYCTKRNLDYMIKKTFVFHFMWGTEVSFSLHCSVYTDNYLYVFIIYCIGRTIYPVVFVLGLYSYN